MYAITYRRCLLSHFGSRSAQTKRPDPPYHFTRTDKWRKQDKKHRNNNGSDGEKRRSRHAINYFINRRNLASSCIAPNNKYIVERKIRSNDPSRVPTWRPFIRGASSNSADEIACPKMDHCWPVSRLMVQSGIIGYISSPIRVIHNSSFCEMWMHRVP